MCIGASCQDIRLTGTLHVQGTNAPKSYAGINISSYEKHRPDTVTDEEFHTLLGHEISPAHWLTTAPLDKNDMVAQIYYAKNTVTRLVCRMLKGMNQRSITKGEPNLNLLFINNIPFRGMGKMMNGMISMQMADDILTIVNGQFSVV